MQLTANFSLDELTVTGRNIPNVPNEAEVFNLSYEVAVAGHDRTIINIKREHVDAWLNPNAAELGALYAIFDDKRHPFYEHRLVA